MLADDLEQTAAALLPHLHIECTLAIADDRLLRSFCESLLIHRISASNRPHPLPTDDAYISGLVTLAIEHLVGRLQMRLMRLVIPGMVDTATSISTPPVEPLLRQAMADWVKSDQNHIAAACDLITQKLPWPGWPIP